MGGGSEVIWKGLYMFRMCCARKTNTLLVIVSVTGTIEADTNRTCRGGV